MPRPNEAEGKQPFNSPKAVMERATNFVKAIQDIDFNAPFVYAAFYKVLPDGTNRLMAVYGKRHDVASEVWRLAYNSDIRPFSSGPFGEESRTWSGPEFINQTQAKLASAKITNEDIDFRLAPERPQSD